MAREQEVSIYRPMRDMILRQVSPSREFLNITRFSKLFITNFRVLHENTLEDCLAFFKHSPSRKTFIQIYFADHVEYKRRTGVTKKVRYAIYVWAGYF